MTNAFTEIVDNSMKIRNAFNEQVIKGAKSIGRTAEKYAKADCPVASGRLKNSISYTVTDDFAEIGIYIGTNVVYASYVEFIDRFKHPVGKAHFLRDAATTHNAEYTALMETALKV